jgi:hypothetical protein
MFFVRLKAKKIGVNIENYTALDIFKSGKFSFKRLAKAVF